jgi:hypothetical protein
MVARRRGWRAIVPRGKALLLSLLLLVFGPPVLLGLILLAALAPGVTVEIDVAELAFATAAVFVAVTAFWVVRYWQRPRETVSIHYDLALTQPAWPAALGGRYTFRLEVYYEVQEKGRCHTLRQGSLELKFRARDHPELLRACQAEVAAQLAAHQRRAAERYPDHEVIPSPAPTLEQVGSEVERRPASSPP